MPLSNFTDAPSRRACATARNASFCAGSTARSAPAPVTRGDGYAIPAAAAFVVRGASFDVFSSVAFPGLGTGVGRVGPNTCARQVRAAIEEVVLGPVPFPRTWAEAQQRHQLLYTDRVRDLQED